MGLLKKIFKPVSKVLDKIVPNEIKPLLPYAAAFAPYMMPGIMGIGGNTMLSRALMSGGLNIGAQLAQEGSEGDINLLSAGLGALQGAMTTPGGLPKGMSPGESMARYGNTTGPLGAEGILKAKAAGMEPGMMKSGLEALSKGSKYLTGAAETLQKTPFSVPGLKAAAIPFAQGTADVMYAEGQRDLKDLANQVVEDMGDGYTDDAYRAAIRKSMTAYGATEQEIIDAIEAAGYRSGGRVGFKDAGLAALGPAGAAKESKWLSKVSPTKEIDTINMIYEEQGNEGLQAHLERNPDLKDKYVIVADAMSGELTVMPNKLHPDNMDMEKIIMIGDGKGGTIDMSTMFEENKAKGGRVGFEFGGIPEAVENVNEEMIEEKKDGMLMEIAKVIFRITPVGAGVMAAKDAYDMYQNLEDEDKEKVQEFGKKALEMAQWTHPAGIAMKAGKAAWDQAKEWDQPQENKMADGGTPSVLPKGIEADYRGGGFIPIGSRERADDVPARLSENEFVMTADAVRAAGGGSVNRGAKRMYDLMHNLEARA